MRDGKRIDGGEVCFVRQEAPVREHDPSLTFFVRADVRCLSADQVVEFPIGRFRFFGRHSSGLIGVNRGAVVRSAQTDGSTYRAVEVVLVPAATVDFSEIVPTLKGEDFLGIWIGETPSVPGTFLPLPSGATSMLVPSNVRVIPLQVSGQKPVRMGEPIAIESGQRHSIRRFASRSGTSDVVGWVRMDEDLFRRAALKTQRQLPPELAALDMPYLESKPATVTLTDASGHVHQPSVPMETPDIGGILVVFKNVPAGPGMLSLRGPTVVADDLRVAISGEEPVVFVSDPLTTAPAGTVLLRWHSDQPGASPFVATISHCDGSDADSCEVLQKRIIPFDAEGWVEIDSLPHGVHRLTVTHPLFQDLSREVTVTPMRRTTLSVDFVPR